jgi:hypothetical protein
MRNYLVDFFGTETTTTQFATQRTHFFSTQQPLIENASPGTINQGGSNASYEFTLPLPTNISYTDIVGVHIRVTARTSNGDAAQLFISQGEGITDERVLSEVDGNGDDNRSEKSSPSFMIYPAKISGNDDALSITLRGNGSNSCRFSVYFDAIDFLERLSVTNTTIGG